MTRLGSLDSGSKYPLTKTETGKHSRSTSVDMNRNKSSKSDAAWKQLNEGLNHLLPMTGKKAIPNQNGAVQISKSPARELRKSSSRSSLYNNEAELESEDDQMYHTVHCGTGGGRKNTLTSSRNLEPFSKITRRRNGEVENSFLSTQLETPLSNASSMHSLYEPIEQFNKSANGVNGPSH